MNHNIIKSAVFFVFLFVAGNLFAEKNTDTLINNKHLSVQGNVFSVTDKSGEVIYNKFFKSVSNSFFLDFNADGNYELYIETEEKMNDETFYTCYFFNVSDSVFLIDSIASGVTKPYHEFSNELNSLYLVTGDSFIDSVITLTKNKLLITPKIFWLYDGNEFFSIEEEMYDNYMAENEDIITMLNDFRNVIKDDCQIARSYRGLLITVFMNYIFAKENVLAHKFVENYYRCSEFKEIIKNLSEIY